jgi:hypothetical protein
MSRNSRFTHPSATRYLLHCPWQFYLPKSVSLQTSSPTYLGLIKMNAVIFNIIMLLVICVKSIPFHLVLVVELLNMYVNIFGIVFATSALRASAFLRAIRHDMNLPIYSLELGPSTCCESDHLNRRASSVLSTASARCQRDPGGQCGGSRRQRQDG